MSEAHALPCMHCQLLPDGSHSYRRWRALLTCLLLLGVFCACAGAHLPDSFRRSTVQKRRMVLEAWHTEDNANVELVPWRSEKVVTSLVERYRPPRCRKVQEKKRNSYESRYLAFGQGWLKGAQDWLK